MHKNRQLWEWQQSRSTLAGLFILTPKQLGFRKACVTVDVLKWYFIVAGVWVVIRSVVSHLLIPALRFYLCFRLYHSGLFCFVLLSLYFIPFVNYFIAARIRYGTLADARYLSNVLYINKSESARCLHQHRRFSVKTTSEKNANVFLDTGHVLADELGNIWGK